MLAPCLLLLFNKVGHLQLLLVDSLHEVQLQYRMLQYYNYYYYYYAREMFQFLLHPRIPYCPFQDMCSFSQIYVLSFANHFIASFKHFELDVWLLLDNVEKIRLRSNFPATYFPPMNDRSSHSDKQNYPLWYIIPTVNTLASTFLRHDQIYV